MQRLHSQQLRVLRRFEHVHDRGELGDSVRLGVDRLVPLQRLEQELQRLHRAGDVVLVLLGRRSLPTAIVSDMGDAVQSLALVVSALELLGE